MHLIVAKAGGMKRKGGGELSIMDFLPAFARSREEVDGEIREQQLMVALQGMAGRSNRKKKHGKK